MRKFIFACALMLSFSVFVGCDKDDDDEPDNIDNVGPGGNGGGSGSSNVSSGNVNLGSDSFTAKYAYVIYGSYFGDDENEYIFADKDLLKYAERGEDTDDIDEEFSTVYIDYDTHYKEIDDVYIEYKYNGYRGTGFYYEVDDYNYDVEIDDYVSLAISGKKVKATTKSLPMVRVNERTGNEAEAKVSFTLEATPIDVADYVDYDDYDYTRGSIEVKEVSDPKQIAFLRSLRHTKAK